ncbi:hypothetical protein ADUPG1_010230 [Aduncisulcus paluster]|uniref:EF-hand domain-containing protein n=1 Tax=Aduncisulcus paluster TaxID=2918883 RepID=A0ABQ5JT20_9EUKA|nr:hypothetical protein ADUPG1_010230 [Aduncisulcus paluster]|eukprot:gnl/Carplike_NY0171/1173_a1588_2164.p1 GENE.gnl/Carplike_NY0171/1173_a1588_2164~~gnl/Carplike_NY0171/1173_a1588_2164.p1  ORF type:complete len:175 (+),score=43.75 gnl/Carplike_NY0171/1173_a1588_2164:26-526(+)
MTITLPPIPVCILENEAMKAIDALITSLREESVEDITFENLPVIAKSLSLDGEDLEIFTEFIKHFDLNDDGKISPDEMYAFALVFNALIMIGCSSQQEIHEIIDFLFEFFDDGSGELEGTEIDFVVQLLSRILDVSDDYVIDEMDIDRDGKITKREFSEYLLTFFD